MLFQQIGEFISSIRFYMRLYKSSAYLC